VTPRPRRQTIPRKGNSILIIHNRFAYPIPPPNRKGETAAVSDQLICPHCHKPVTTYRNPFPTVDIIIRVGDRIVLIERKNTPQGWALPGGFVDYGESLEQAAIREAAEETGLQLQALRQFGAYSDPARDPRQHNISFVFTAEGRGTLRGGDDAARAILYPLDALPSPLCFDHARILADYRRHLKG
jgi:ADP-ribose pyrophosphatase YjhB (NUDIX family)